MGPMHRLARGLALAPSLVLLAALASAQSANDFVTGLENARRLVDRQRWDPAEKALHDLLSEHEGAGHAIARRLEVRDLLERCAFGRGYAEPDPDDLLDGELKRWKPETGEIEILYPRGLTLTPPLEARKNEEPRQVGDWLDRNGLWTHPISFKDDYQITLRGQGGLYVFLGYGGENYYFLDLSGSPTIYQYQGKRKVEIDSNPRKDLPGTLQRARKPELRIQVNERRVRVLVGGENLLDARVPDPPLGIFGLLGRFEAEWVRLEGKSTGTWLGGQLDERRREALEAFRQAHDPELALPEWMRVEVGRGGAKEEDETARIPGTPRESWKAALETIDDLLGKGKYRDALAFTSQLADAEVGETFRLWNEIWLLNLLQEYETANQRAERLLALEPEHVPTRVLYARTLGLTVGHEAARRQLEDWIRDDASHELEAALVHEFLVDGRAEDARQALDAALAGGADPAAFEEVNGLVVRALSGPSWTTRNEHSTRHYVVATDMDRSMAYEAAQELEAAFAKYRRDLSQVSGNDGRRFRVFLFSGEAGYQEYCRDLQGGEPHSTLGLYRPDLDQLLIWNSPFRDQVLRTVRHEGFHQYLDRVTSQAPRWLHEGLAEYYETSVLENGNWKDGLPHPDHVPDWRRRDDWTPLREFVYGSSAEYNVDPSKHYSQAWGFVHWLRHGAEPAPTIFKRLMGALESGASRREALARAFEGLDWDALERVYREHGKRF